MLEKQRSFSPYLSIKKEKGMEKDKDKEKYWIWLARWQGIGSKKIQSLLEYFKHPQNIWEADQKTLLEVKGIGEKLAQEIVKEEYRKDLEKYQWYMEEHNIRILTIQEESYPYRLKQIYDPPIVLFLKGSPEILNKKSIAMVGCRKCSDYGKKVAMYLAEELTKQNILIISGLAEGIDTYSHIGCLNQKGRTIAVVGNGLDMVYPYFNRTLEKKILDQGGCIVSEYIVGTKPRKMNFPARNRIISGLSQGVVVVEARKKSGTWITVDFALEQGKDIYVVPGNITSCNSEGTNELIKQGAKLITEVEDIIN